MERPSLQNKRLPQNDKERVPDENRRQKSHYLRVGRQKSVKVIREGDSIQGSTDHARWRRGFAIWMNGPASVTPTNPWPCVNSVTQEGGLHCYVANSGRGSQPRINGAALHWIAAVLGQT